MTADLVHGLSELDSAAPDYTTAHDYYTGNVEEFFASARMRRLIQREGADVNFNFAKRPVDAVADRLEIVGITTTDEGANALLQHAWEANQLDLEAPSIMRRACEYGDSYIIVWPRESSDLTPDNQSGTAEVSVYFNSPLTTRAIYNAENPLVMDYVIKRWVENDGRRRVDLYYTDRIESYVSREGTKGDRAEHFEPFTEDDDAEWPTPNPFDQIPVFHFRTDRPFGSPLHEGFYGPQDAINKLIASHLSSVDYQGWPQRWALLAADGDSSDADDSDADDFAFDDDPASGDAEGQSQFTASPGSLWYMRGVQGVGQFEAAQPAVFTDPMLTYLRMGAELTNTPLHRVDPTGDHPSGESLRTAEAPFIKTVRSMQMSFGATWRAAFTFVLHLLGVDDKPVQVSWAPAQTMDDEDFWTVAEKKIAAGVPARQVLMEAGYTEEQVTAWLGAADTPATSPAKS